MHVWRLNNGNATRMAEDGTRILTVMDSPGLWCAGGVRVQQRNRPASD